MKLENLGFNGAVEVVNKITGEIAMVTNGLNVKYNEEILIVKEGKVKRTFNRMEYSAIAKVDDKVSDLTERENETMNETNTNEGMDKDSVFDGNMNFPVKVEEKLIIPSNDDDIVNLVFNEKEIDEIANAGRKTYEVIVVDNKKGNVLSEARDKFILAYSDSLKLGENVQWAQRQIIARTMSSKHYKASFINDSDYANQINVSKSYLSKACKACEIREWLINNNYGTNWNATAIEEIIPKWNELQKAKIDFKQFMDFSGFSEGMTVKQARECVKKYKEEMTPKTISAPVTTVSVPSAPVTTVSVPSAPVTTVSVPSAPFNDMIKNFNVDTAECKEMNISLSFGDLSMDIWLNKEDNKKLINNIYRLIKGKVRVEISSMQSN